MINIFTDGACQPNPGQMGVGVVIEWQGKNPTIISESAGHGTNNQAEYLALLRALRFMKEEKVLSATIKSDSTLMVKQVNREWKCKDKELQVLLLDAHSRIEELENNGSSIKLVYIPREFNVADTPAKNGVDKK